MSVYGRWSLIREVVEVRFYCSIIRARTVGQTTRISCASRFYLASLLLKSFVQEHCTAVHQHAHVELRPCRRPHLLESSSTSPFSCRYGAIRQHSRDLGPIELPQSRRLVSCRRQLISEVGAVHTLSGKAS